MANSQLSAVLYNHYAHARTQEKVFSFVNLGPSLLAKVVHLTHVAEMVQQSLTKLSPVPTLNFLHKHDRPFSHKPEICYFEKVLPLAI